MSIVQKTESGKILYVICYEYQLPPDQWRHRGDFRDWRTGQEYMHAEDAGEVRVMFLNSGDPKFQTQCRIVGIAPAIGFQVADEHGERLIA